MATVLGGKVDIAMGMTTLLFHTLYLIFVVNLHTFDNLPILQQSDLANLA